MNGRTEVMDAQGLHFVLPPPYAPCGKGHTHHPEDWPASGEITIEKCERQCRFRDCKAWSQTAAALRKHVNKHIQHNSLPLKVVSASSGREPLKISLDHESTPSSQTEHVQDSQMFVYSQIGNQTLVPDIRGSSLPDARPNILLQGESDHATQPQSSQEANETLQTHDEPWIDYTRSENVGNDPVVLICPTCRRYVKTRFELIKHKLRHSKPFKCKVLNCTRVGGFSTTNDLDRHVRSRHPTQHPDIQPEKRYRCPVEGCMSVELSWPRLDKFRSHLKLAHSAQLRSDDAIDYFTLRAEYWETTVVEPAANGQGLSVSSGTEVKNSIGDQPLHVLADSAVSLQAFPHGMQMQVSND